MTVSLAPSSCTHAQPTIHLRNLDSPVKVTDSDESLESSPLTGRSLLLDRLDAHDLVLEGGEEKVDDLVFSDREGE